MAELRPKKEQATASRARPTAPRNLGHIRDINRNIILRTIWKNREISRAELSRRTHLTKTTVSSLVSELVERNLVTELDENGSSTAGIPGRRPIRLSIDPDAAFCMAVDLKARETLVASYDLLVNSLGCRRLPRKSSEPEEVVRQIASAVEELCREAGRGPDDVVAMGVSVPGKAEYDGGRIIWSPELGWYDVDMRELLGRCLATGTAVYLDCDAQLALRAELWRGTNLRETSTAVYVLVSETVTSGLALTGKLYHGEAYASGSFAHMQVDPTGPECACGGRGCWGSFVSVDRMLRQYFGRESAYHDPAEALGALRNACLAGEARALEALDEEAKWLALGLANIFNAVDPEAIVVGGYVGLVWDVMQSSVTEQVRRRLAPIHGWQYREREPKRIVGSVLDPMNNLEGAALLAISTIIPVDLFQDLVVYNMERLEETLF